MKCITLPALDNVEIAIYVDGEADETVKAHIEQCPYCRERARQWTLLQNGLRRQLYRANCPTSMELGEFHLDHLTGIQELVVSRHLQECLLCQREVEILKQFLADQAPETSLLGAVKVLIARFVGVQAETGLVPALRGEGRGPLTFDADGTLIVLDVQPAREGKVSILGQVAADDQDKWTDALVEIHQDDRLQVSTVVDDLGAFQSDDMEPGSSELRIKSKDGTLILVSSLTL